MEGFTSSSIPDRPALKVSATSGYEASCGSEGLGDAQPAQALALIIAAIGISTNYSTIGSFTACLTKIYMVPYLLTILIFFFTSISRAPVLSSIVKFQNGIAPLKTPKFRANHVI